MRAKSILEVILFFIGIYLIGWAMDLTGIFQWERNLTGFNWIFPLFSIGIFLFLFMLTKRQFKTYGLTIETWKLELDLSLNSLLLYIPPFLLGFWILIQFNLSYAEFPGGVIMAAVTIVAIFLIFNVINRKYSEITPDKKVATKSNLLLLITLLLLPLLLGFYFTKPILPIATTIIWQFFISGFQEEILYRGYFQSRINEEYGRPYMFLGVNFGIGLIVASLLFALAHIFNPFNPFTGQTQLAWFWGIWTFFSGLLYGLLREKTNTIIACALLHGLTGAIGQSLALVFGWTL
ncbi:MAG: CPBP family intramembrane metalloprotease [Promethearchaeota archaeon]|nr:MAG: CPBP family intramembrane metalloprotease [Candidatus Lokiarchaeota archaeon]